ncbi:MAG: hypothetical protein SGJ18_07715 [Pseudomonadota bacterium]|nr:hypothetical protein [Pseudomonadota bacterium]
MIQQEQISIDVAIKFIYSQAFFITPMVHPMLASPRSVGMVKEKIITSNPQLNPELMPTGLKKKFLKIYANPLKVKLNLKSTSKRFQTPAIRR